MNTFAYVGGDPISFFDPLGLRPLTSGEIAIARSIFGNSINYSEVEILQERFAGIIPVPDQRAMTPSGNIYFHPSNRFYSDDFSEQGDQSRREFLDLQGLFIHEMVHVWQHQNGINVIAGGIVAANRYGYELSCERSLTEDYNIEQQGNIIMDYFFRLNNHITGAWASQTNNPDYNLDLYELVLQDFLADPNYLQGEVEEQGEERRRRNTNRPGSRR